MADFTSLGRTVAPSLFTTRRYHCLSACSRGSLTHSRPNRALRLPPQSQTGGIPLLLETILFSYSKNETKQVKIGC